MYLILLSKRCINLQLYKSKLNIYFSPIKVTWKVILVYTLTCLVNSKSRCNTHRSTHVMIISGCKLCYFKNHTKPDQSTISLKKVRVYSIQNQIWKFQKPFCAICVYKSFNAVRTNQLIVCLVFKIVFVWSFISSTGLLTRQLQLRLSFANNLPSCDTFNLHSAFLH